MKQRIIAFLIIVLCLSNILMAQEGRSNNALLKNHHSISVNMGIKGSATSSVTGFVPMVEMKSGFIGGIEYGYWFNDEWQLGLNFEMVQASTNLNFADVNNNAVVSMLFGFKYYPESMKLGEVGRVYAGLYAGPVVGFATIGSGLPVISKNVTETVVGGQAIAGVDLFVAKWFKLGPSINYNLMTDFSEISGSKKNFSGFGFVFNLGLVL